METSALPLEKTNGSVPSPPKVNGNAISTTPSPTFTPKLSPFQIVILAAYPITVLLGILSNYPQDSYFSRKDNFINIVFLKFTWGWTSLAFFLHLARVPQKVAPLARYATATIWWTLVTQWAFGAPIMDKVFRGTGGMCEIAKNEEFPAVFTSAVCRASGGTWNGGHDLSGHIFLLTHASLFLWWELLPHFSTPAFQSRTATKVNFAVLALWWFSLLNTATYFHTLLEKVTGLFAGLLGWYIVHVLTTNALTIAGIQDM